MYNARTSMPPEVLNIYKKRTLTIIDIATNESENCMRINSAKTNILLFSII